MPGVRARTRMTIGRLWVRQGDIDKGHPELQAAAEEFHRLGDWWWEARTHRIAGDDALTVMLLRPGPDPGPLKSERHEPPAAARKKPEQGRGAHREAGPATPERFPERTRAVKDVQAVSRWELRCVHVAREARDWHEWLRYHADKPVFPMGRFP